MLEKHLPFFRRPQQDPPKPPEEKQKRNNEFFERFRDPSLPLPVHTGHNLIFHQDDTPYNAVLLRVSTSVFKKTSAFLILLFAILLLVNYYYTLKLASAEVVTEDLANRVSRYTNLRKQAMEIDEKTRFYEKTLSERAVIGDKTRLIFQHIGPELQVKKLEVNVEKFTLELTVASPLDFAKLTAKYLEEDLIKSITLKSADLEASRQLFRVEMEGTF